MAQVQQDKGIMVVREEARNGVGLHMKPAVAVVLVR
tara:strand:- start:158 stop:265 length:108 start_codon:yes stop_codon:yes gene_type:complete